MKNSIWITRTSYGYCARYKTPKADEYLTSSEESNHNAGYVSFPTLLTQITRLSRDFYQSGVVVKADPKAQEKMPLEEIAAIKKVVSKLECFAKDALEKEREIYSVLKCLGAHRH
jgi:hypothetical protein